MGLPQMSDKSKTCSLCREEKNLLDFFRSSKNKDGLQAYCKSCCKKSKQNSGWKKEPRKRREYANKYRANNTPKVIAWKLMNLAIRTGFLKKMPCEVCGCQDSLGHHESYQRPLDITWLCAAHHGARHKEIRDQSVSLQQSAA